MKKPVIGVVVFPGSNCDHDAYHVFKHILGEDTRFLWHKERLTKGYDIIILPGGFSYGDYLRTGAIARFSPIMEDVMAFAEKGGVVMGICNGFQILTESGLLPGVLVRNQSLRFVCKDTFLKITNYDSAFTSGIREKQVLRIPVAHGDGSYFAPPDVLAEIEGNNQVVFRYSDESGNITADSNPNGSLGNIAGIINKRGNVLGMMPHPERCSDNTLGNDSGIDIFKSLIKNLM
ncbi:MAG: phosphoribosylformylglycinamidine synthase subunit PurQ [Ignavibacteriaceae bacterium]|nr:phosphoribosylformylglycinamidine synthase subunit PurQ [Ignavibacteriaceae bacterium]